MENMELWERFKDTPMEARKEIQGGHLKGKTDINPMLRIKQLTAAFGPCGTGWWTKNVRYTRETANPQNGEIPIFCELELYYLADGEVRGPVYGCGGNMLIQMQKSGLYTNDEAYKMAYTDAISVACKNLGMCADIYYQNDRTKYTLQGELANAPEPPKPAQPKQPAFRPQPQAPSAPVTTAATLPPVQEPKKPKFENPVQQYLLTEKNKILVSFQINDQGFMSMWKGMIEAGIPNLPAYGTKSTDMKQEEAEALIAAIWQNYEPAPQEAAS